MPKTLWYIFGWTVISAIFFTVYIKFGVSIDPADILTNTGGQVAQATNNAQAISIWNNTTFLIAIMGILQTITSIIAIAVRKWKGFTVASTGFFGMLFLILGVLGLGEFAEYAGIISLVVGCLICFIFEGEAPTDIFSSNF